VDGMTFEEVGEQMELSASGVRRRLDKLKTRVAGLAVRAGRDQAPARSGKESR
jgi:predicted ArsR family transcriptional regulator